MLSLFHGEFGTLIPWTLHDITEPLVRKRDRTGLSRTEVQEWELVDSGAFKTGQLSHTAPSTCFPSMHM